MYIDKEGKNEDNDFGVDIKFVPNFDEIDAKKDHSQNKNDEIDSKQYFSHHFN